MELSVQIGLQSKSIENNRMKDLITKKLNMWYFFIDLLTCQVLPEVVVCFSYSYLDGSFRDLVAAICLAEEVRKTGAIMGERELGKVRHLVRAGVGDKWAAKVVVEAEHGQVITVVS